MGRRDVRVGLLGGSFDPIHLGHLLVAQALVERLELDQVRLIPVREQPFKAGRHGAGAEDRAAMVALGILGEFGLMVDRVEVDRPGPSYTADTLRLLRAREPDISWTLLVGTDAAKDLPLWRESATIPTLAEIVVFNRPGTESSPIPGLRSIEVPAVDISATAVRQRVNRGRSIRYWVPDAVATYIAAHRLYRDEES